MQSLGLKLEGAIFRYDGDDYLAHSECADLVVASMPLGSVVIIGPVAWADADKCAYAKCDKQ